MKKRKRKKTFDARKEIKAIARERVGSVKPSRTIPPKSGRKPKHKKKPEEESTNLE